MHKIFIKALCRRCSACWISANCKLIVPQAPIKNTERYCVSTIGAQSCSKTTPFDFTAGQKEFYKLQEILDINLSKMLKFLFVNITFVPMNDFAKRNFNLILFLSTIAGFVLPEFGEISGMLILAVLSLIIFSSSFKVNFSVQFFKERAGLIFAFYLVRFILLPVLCFYLILPFSPFYASSVFLLFVLPAGVTAPAFTNVFGGNVALALVLLILSSFLTPLVLPVLSGVLMTEVLNIDQSKLFFTLFITVIFPYIAHLPFRKSRYITNWMQNHDSFISIIGIALIFALAIAEYKSVLLTQPDLVLPFFLVALAGFIFLYLFGWSFFYRAPTSDKIAMLFNSGANNVALGVVISFLYFPVKTGIFFIVCEIVWVLILIPVKKWLGKDAIYRV